MKILVTVILIGALIAGIVQGCFDVTRNAEGYDILILDKKNHKIGCGIEYKRRIRFNIIGNELIGKGADRAMDKKLQPVLD